MERDKPTEDTTCGFVVSRAKLPLGGGSVVDVIGSLVYCKIAPLLCMCQKCPQLFYYLLSQKASESDSTQF